MATRWTVWALGLALAGCATRRPPAPTPPPTSQPPTRTADAELLALADAVDPGPKSPMFEVLPPWVRTRLGESPDRTVATADIREALLAWDKLKPGDLSIPALMNLGRVLLLAEQAVQAGSDDPELLLALARVYAIFDAPALASEHGLFQQILQMAAQMLDLHKPTQESIDTAKLIDVLRTLLRSADDLHRHTAAQLLRRHPDHPEVPRVLARLVEPTLRSERWDLALRLRSKSLALLGPRALGADHLDQAWTCYKALDLTCGDAAIQRGRTLGPADPQDPKVVAAHATRVAALEAQATQVRRVLELAADPRVHDPGHADLAPALERGHLLVLLDHPGEARALYDALRAAHPDDARPHAGLAKLAVQQRGDFIGGAAEIAAARGKLHRDRDFYEVALGTTGVKLMSEAIPKLARGPLTDRDFFKPVLDDLQAHAEGYRAFDPARADVVLALLATGRAAIPKIAASDPTAIRAMIYDLRARIDALAKLHPNSVDVRMLAYLALTFSSAGPQALAEARRPLAPALAGDLAMQRRRVQTWLDLTMLWELPAELPDLQRAIEALPDDPADELRPGALAMVLAMKHRATGDTAAGNQALGLFMAQAQRTSGEARAVALSNAGALAVGLGDPQSGLAAFAEAVASDGKATAAKLNIAATILAVEGGQRPELAEVFAMVAQDSSSQLLQLHAQAWRHEQAQRGTGDVEVTRADFAAQLASARAQELRGTMPLARWGIYTSGSVQLSLGYSVPASFAIVNQVTSTRWIIAPAPGLDALIAAIDKARTKPGKPRARPR